MQKIKFTGEPDSGFNQETGKRIPVTFLVLKLTLK